MKDTSIPALPPVALRVFNTLPISCLVLSPQLNILTLSNNFATLTSTNREEISGQSLFDIFPEWQNSSNGRLNTVLQQAINTGQAQQLSGIAFSLPGNGLALTLQPAQYQITIEPVKHENSELNYLILAIEETKNDLPVGGNDGGSSNTPSYVDTLSRQMEVLFHAVPAQIAIVSGPELVYTYINPQYKKELFPDRDVLGLPLLKALPEITNQPIWKTLHQVYTTGVPYIDTEIKVPLAGLTGGKTEDHYFNVVYQPLRNAQGEINAILSFKYEITQQVAARMLLEQKEWDLQRLNEELQQSYEELQASNEELQSGNEELEATNDELKKTQDNLATLNDNLEERIKERTAKLQDSEHEQQVLNEELTAINEELSATNDDLTDSRNNLKELVEQLAKSEEQIRSLVQSAPFPIGVYIGREMRIQMLNQAIIDAWGRGSDLIGKTYAEVLPELAGTGIYDILERVYDTGVPYHAENQRVDLMADGQLQPFYFNYDFTPLFDKQSKVYGVMNTAANVTDLVNAKLQVEQSRKSLYNIIMRSPVSKCILLGEDYTIDVVNDRMLALWGKNRDAVNQLPMFDAIPESRGQGLEELLQDVYTTGNTYEAKERPVKLIRNREPEIFYLDFVYQPFRDAHENITGVIVTAIDVTSQVVTREEIQQLNEELATTNEELKSANDIQAAINEELAILNDALKISQDEVQLAIDAAGLATFDLNPSTGRFAGNDLTKAWFGLQPADEIELSKAIAAIADEDSERVTQAIQYALDYSSGGGYDIIYTINNPLTQKPRVVRAKGKALFNEHQQPTRLSGVLIDVTEQKKDEQRKNDFIGIVSHELKTPLTSLKALIQVSGHKLKKSDDVFLQSAVEKSIVQIRKMESMINGFLNVSRLELGKMAIEKTRFNMQDMITTLIKEAELTITSHQIKFESCDPVFINADYNKIESVLSNLISNAAKYSARDTRITVSCQVSPTTVQVSVKDEGMGISAEDRKKIFDRYFRVESSQAKHISGFGIGLYLSAEIIQRHSGNIGVDSVLGEGSTFYFELPLYDELLA
ncbi:PAS domain-containing protein [Mucilaginibacter sp. CSA2-8R]|uniref:PAS domain-containing protein n=1 Tax=Mucilaginibacter sp. CSA2-8R TaxID=3141542 RepID=UPI00315D3ECB